MAEVHGSDEDRYISGIYLALAGQDGDPEVRTWALDHAARVDANRGDGHEFGRRTLRVVLGRALSNYFVRSGIEVPEEDATGQGSDSRNLYSDTDIRVVQSVIRAFGASEGAVVIGPPDPADPEADRISAVASYDLTVPGARFLKTAAQVISWPRKSTLFV